MKSPSPDREFFINYLSGKINGKPPLVEYLIDEVVMKPIISEKLGRQWVDFSGNREDQIGYLENFISFWYHLGYDFVRFEQNAGFPTPQIPFADTAQDSTKIRMWAEEHHGLIKTWEDFETLYHFSMKMSLIEHR